MRCGSKGRSIGTARLFFWIGGSRLVRTDGGPVPNQETGRLLRRHVVNECFVACLIRLHSRPAVITFAIRNPIQREVVH